MTDELETLRQRVKDYENRIIGVGGVAINSVGRDAYEGCREDLLDWKKRALQAEAKLAALKQGQGEPVAWIFDLGGSPEGWLKEVLAYLNDLAEIDDPYRAVWPFNRAAELLLATPTPNESQTCFSAGDMADAQAKSFQAGRDNNRAAIAELVRTGRAVVARWDSPSWKDLPHTGEFIAALREAIAKHEPANIHRLNESTTTNKEQ